MEVSALFIAILVFAFILYACLKVASDADDAIEKMMEKKRRKK